MSFIDLNLKPFEWQESFSNVYHSEKVSLTESEEDLKFFIRQNKKIGVSIPEQVIMRVKGERVLKSLKK